MEIKQQSKLRELMNHQNMRVREKPKETKGKKYGPNRYESAFGRLQGRNNVNNRRGRTDDKSVKRSVPRNRSPHKLVVVGETDGSTLDRSADTGESGDNGRDDGSRSDGTT